METTDRKNEKPKKKTMLSSGLKFLVRPIKQINGNKKPEIQTVEVDKPALHLVQFNGTETNGVCPMDQGEKQRLQRTDVKEMVDCDGNLSPCSSGSRSSDLFDKKSSTLEKFETMLNKSRNGSEQSIALSDSNETKLKNIYEWEYKMNGYQAKYQVLVQEKINPKNSVNNAMTTWDGNFPKNSDSYQLLKKVERKANLTKKDITLAKWVVLTEMQYEFPSNLIAEALPQLFEKIIGFLSDNSVPEIFVQTFWGSTEKLIVESFAMLTSNGTRMQILSELPSVSLPMLCFLKFWEMLQNFRKRDRGSFTTAEVKLLVTMDLIKENLPQELIIGAEEWFRSRFSLINDCTVVTLTDIAYTLRNDLAQRKQSLVNLFSSFNINLFDVVYSVWTTKFGEVVTPLIVTACSRPDEFAREDISKTTVVDFDSSERLYNLLEASKNFFTLADKPKLFHELFLPCIPKWLDVNCVRALTHLEKAVAIDKLVVSHPTLRTSGSAEDAEAIFHTMKRLWNELNWPQLEERFSLAVLLIKNLDRCILYYANLVDRRLKELDATRFEDFEISDELCVALNNVEKVRQYAESVVTNLNISSILESMAKHKTSESSIQQCRCTPPALMENMTDKVNRKMLEYFRSACYNLEPMISTLLETAASITQVPDVDSLGNPSISHLDRSLSKLKTKLSPEGFEKTFPILWNNVFNAFSTIVDTSVQKKKAPVVFQHLKYLFDCLVSLFFPEPNGFTHIDLDDTQRIDELKLKLQLYASSSPKLILDYYQERLETQVAFGFAELSNQIFLTVVPDRDSTNGQLRLQILNAVTPETDSDCYVRFQIVTPDFCETTKKYTTGVVKRNKYLLFENLFTIDISNEEWSSGGMIHFWMKARCVIRWNKFLGEAFLPLKDIPITTQENPIRNSAQVRFPLTRPTELNSRFLQLLQDRTGDKFATHFVDIEHQRINSLSTETHVTTQ